MSQIVLLAIAWLFMVGATALNLALALRRHRMIAQTIRLNLMLSHCCLLAWTMRGWPIGNFIDFAEDAADGCQGAQHPPH